MFTLLGERRTAQKVRCRSHDILIARELVDHLADTPVETSY